MLTSIVNDDGKHRVIQNKCSANFIISVCPEKAEKERDENASIKHLQCVAAN